MDTGPSSNLINLDKTFNVGENTLASEGESNQSETFKQKLINNKIVPTINIQSSSSIEAEITKTETIATTSETMNTVASDSDSDTEEGDFQIKRFLLRKND